MIVDTSALLAILFREPDHADFVTALAGDSVRMISAVSVFEAVCVTYHRQGLAGLSDLDALINLFALRVMPFTTGQAALARDAFLYFGKGSHPARLNMGDCCSYALARETGEPLLFKGNDFTQTDIQPALAL